MPHSIATDDVCAHCPLLRAQAERGRAAEIGGLFVSRVGRRIDLIPVDQIKAFVTEHKVTQIIHVGGEGYLGESLKSLATRLPGFLHIHRGVLINPRFVVGVTLRSRGYRKHCGMALQVADEPTEYPVTQRRISMVRAWLKAQTKLGASHAAA